MLPHILLFVLLSAIATYAQPQFLPITGSGTCTKDTPYTINSISDLKSNLKDLECIFAAGIAPTAIGLGFNYGTVLLGENSFTVQPFAAPFYQGDYVVRTTCQGSTVHLGTLKVAGISVGTAPWSIGKLPGAVAATEFIDPTIDNIVMDFRKNVQDICPIEDLTAMLNSKGFLPFRNPPPPINCFVDIARVVGRDAQDGGIILLAKGMNQDPVKGFQTSLIYAIKNFDQTVNPSFKSGTPIVVPASFSYVHHGFGNTLSRFGAAGLMPFLMQGRQNLATALTSNPIVAALALKAAGLNTLEGGSSQPFFFDKFLASDTLLKEMVLKHLDRFTDMQLFSELESFTSRGGVSSPENNQKRTEAVDSISDVARQLELIEESDWRISALPVIAQVLSAENNDGSAPKKLLEFQDLMLGLIAYYNTQHQSSTKINIRDGN